MFTELNHCKLRGGNGGVMPGLSVICVSCHAPLRLDGTDEVVCTACGFSFGKLGRVPVLARGSKVAERRRPDDAFVDDIAAIISPNPSIGLKTELTAVFSRSVQFGNLDLQVEADQFINRLVNSGCRVSPIDGASGASVEASDDDQGLPVNTDLSLQITETIAPAGVSAGSWFSVQVRIRNRGLSAAVSSGETPALLAYFCRSLDDADAPETIGGRTALLIDLDPGMQITMPVLLQAPEEPGRYSFKIAALQEHVRWFLDEAVTFETEVIAEGDPLDTDWPRGTTLRDYAADHISAMDLLARWLDRYEPMPEPVSLELGGNANPSIARLPGVKFNVDVDAFGLAFGEIRQRAENRSGVTFIAADGTDLPFPDHSFDCVAMFATFHHFPDPIGLLRHLRTKLRQGGLLCLMCEPIGHVFRDHAAPEYVAELRRGVNEQSFQPWEYRDMLMGAGFDIIEALIDIGSIKIAARPTAS